MICMLVLASSQPPSPADSYCSKRWSCPHSSLYCLWSLPVCTASLLSCLTWPQTRQSKENEFFARLVSRISLFLRASCREELRSPGYGKEKAMCGQKVTLAWWRGSAGLAVWELCPKHSFLSIHQDANSVQLIP